MYTYKIITYIITYKITFRQASDKKVREGEKEASLTVIRQSD